MLHKDPFIIHPETFRLTQQLLALPELADFYLVGGTSLALQLGHRNSIDIDLFSQNDFITENIVQLLNSKFDVNISFILEKNTLMAYLNNIKTDFIRHPYPFIRKPLEEEGIRYLGIEDIAAMKINAIINSGKRLKDFVDIYYILEIYSMNEIIAFFKEKYPHMNPLIAYKAIIFFDEIDPEMDPPKMKAKLSISKIKNRIEEAVLKSNKKF